MANIGELEGGLISCHTTKKMVLKKEPERVLYSDSAFSVGENFSRG